MARDVDTLIVVTPGGPGTQSLVNAAVLEALGPRGILINVRAARWWTRRR